MFESSRDIVNFSVAGAVALLTVFICWFLFYLIMMVRRTSLMVKSVHDKLETVDRILNLVRDKLEKGTSHMAMVADTIIKLAGFVMEKQQKSAGKKRAKK